VDVILFDRRVGGCNLPLNLGGFGRFALAVDRREFGDRFGFGWRGSGKDVILARSHAIFKVSLSAIYVVSVANDHSLYVLDPLEHLHVLVVDFRFVNCPLSLSKLLSLILSIG